MRVGEIEMKLTEERKKIKGFSQEYYDYGTLTKHDFDLILENQEKADNLKTNSIDNN